MAFEARRLGWRLRRGRSAPPAPTAPEQYGRRGDRRAWSSRAARSSMSRSFVDELNKTNHRVDGYTPPPPPFLKAKLAEGA